MSNEELINIIGSQPEDGNEQAEGLLNEANNATATDRCCQYGEAEVNLSMQGVLQQAVARCLKLRADKGHRSLHPGVEGSLNSLMIKVARIISAPQIKRDTLVDAIGYLITLFRCDLADKNNVKVEVATFGTGSIVFTDEQIRAYIASVSLNSATGYTPDATEALKALQALGTSEASIFNILNNDNKRGHDWNRPRYVDPDIPPLNCVDTAHAPDSSVEEGYSWLHVGWDKLPSVTFNSESGDNNYKIYMNINSDGELNPKQPYFYFRVSGATDSDTNES